MRRLTLAVVILAAAGAAFASGTPFPAEKRGSGNEPTKGGGIFAGKQYGTRSAVVEWDGFLKSLNLYLFQTDVTCKGFTAAAGTGQLVHAFLDMPKGSHPVPAGLQPGRWYVEFEIHPKKGGVRVAEVQPGVKLVFSRVDSTPGGVWHGRLTVPRSVISGKPYSYGGTFAARWCGST